MHPSQQFNNASRNNIRVARLHMIETGTYNPQFSRPYMTHVDGTSMDNILRRVDQAGGSKITGSLLSGVTSNILSPSATPGGEIPISLGWQARRIRFVMEVHVEQMSGSQSIYYFQGYTSHAGVGMGGVVDPTMDFIINSYVRITRAMQSTAYGTTVRDVITESAQVINGQIVNQVAGGNVYGMRPQDIFTGIQSQGLSQAYSNYHGDVLDDTRIRFHGEPVRTKRANNLPSHFVAEIIDSCRVANELQDFGQNDQGLVERSRELVYEAPPNENPVIRALSNIRGLYVTTIFSFNDLCQLDPNTRSPEVTKFHAMGQAQKATLHSAGQTEFWHIPSRETLAASILSSAVPALMMESMLQSICFKATNHDASGRVTTTIYGIPRSFSNADMSPFIQLLVDRLEREVFFDMTYGNQVLFQLQMECNLFEDTKISVSLDGGPMITYMTPSFCDSLLTPVMTASKENYQQVVSDFDDLRNKLSGRHQTSPLTVNNLV